MGIAEDAKVFNYCYFYLDTPHPKMEGGALDLNPIYTHLVEFTCSYHYGKVFVYRPFTGFLVWRGVVSIRKPL